MEIDDWLDEPNRSTKDRLHDKLPNGGYDPVLGIIRAEGAPEAYKWAVDRLVEEFGWEAVRIAVPTDYGRTQRIGVLLENGRGSAFPLFQVYLNTPMYNNNGKISHWEDVDTFDLNRNPQFLDRFIDSMKAMRDG